MLELLLSLTLQNTFQITISGPLRLVDLLLFIFFLYTLIINKGKISFSKNLFILVGIRIIYILFVLYFRNKLNLATFFSLGYFFEFILVVLIAINLKKYLDFNKLWKIGVFLVIINNLASIIMFNISSFEGRAGGLIGSSITAFALPFILYGLFIERGNQHYFLYRMVALIGIAGAVLSEQRTLLILLVLNILLYLLTLKSKLIAKLPNLMILFLVMSLGAIYLIPDSLKEFYQGKMNEVFDSLAVNNGSSMYTRYVLWESAINIFKTFPILGIGSGVFSRLSWIELQSYTMKIVSDRMVGLSTHNFLLEYLAELGLLGTSLTYLIIGIIFSNLKKKASTLGLSSQFEFRIMYSSLMTLTLYDLFGQGTFLYFWNYSLMLLYVYLFTKEREHFKSLESELTR